jgi:hypothetical protein
LWGSRKNCPNAHCHHADHEPEFREAFDSLITNEGMLDLLDREHEELMKHM